MVDAIDDEHLDLDELNMEDFEMAEDDALIEDPVEAPAKLNEASEKEEQEATEVKEIAPAESVVLPELN